MIESYGTGAVMGVPAHDERDRRFASERGLAVSDAPLLDHAVAEDGSAARRSDTECGTGSSRASGTGVLPIPIVHCLSDVVQWPSAENALPVLLPLITDFRPTGTGVSPLATDATFVETCCPACDGPARRETDVSDTFVDSAWYFLRYPSTEFEDRAWDDDRTRPAATGRLLCGGPEHVQRHHLYARFLTMALYDLGLVPFEEPFPRIRLGGCS